MVTRRQICVKPLVGTGLRRTRPIREASCPGSLSAPVPAAHAAGGGRAGDGAEEGEPRAHGRAGQKDSAGPAGLGAGRTHAAADVPPHRADRAQGTRQKETFGRFEAERPNELWVGDALHGPRIDGRKRYLFAFLDDRSRTVVGHRWGYAEDTVRLAAALRPVPAARLRRRRRPQPSRWTPCPVPRPPLVCGCAGPRRRRTRRSGRCRRGP